MSISYQITKTVFDGSTNLSKTVALTAGQDIRVDEDLGVVVDQQVDVAFVRGRLKAIYMVADQDCTVKTNSSGAPQETISLSAGKPFAWDATDGSAVSTRFAGDVTKLYVTTTVATNLVVRALVDPTP